MGAKGDRGLMEIQDNNQRALEVVFNRLRMAEDHLQRATIPSVPIGRPRVFRIARYFWPVAGTAPGSLKKGMLGNLPWPKIQAKSSSQWSSVDSPATLVDSYAEAATSIVQWTGNQPHRVWRVIRQINAVIAWCEKRAEGRRRAAEEILRQQSPWINKIASEVLVEELAGAGPLKPLSVNGWFTAKLADGTKMAAPYWGASDDKEEP